MTEIYDAAHPAYWRRFARTAREMHAKHVAMARSARRWGWNAEAARFLTGAAVDRNMLVIALDMQRRLMLRRLEAPCAGELVP